MSIENKQQQVDNNARFGKQWLQHSEELSKMIAFCDENIKEIEDKVMEGKLTEEQGAMRVEDFEGVRRKLFVLRGDMNRLKFLTTPIYRGAYTKW